MIASLTPCGNIAHTNLQGDRNDDSIGDEDGYEYMAVDDDTAM